MSHQSHSLGVSNTIRYLREKLWRPGLSTDVKRYIGDGVSYAIALLRNDPPPIYNHPLSAGPWQEIAMDYKGPIGGKHGFYYQIIVDTYSHYPEVTVVNDT